MYEMTIPKFIRDSLALYQDKEYIVYKNKRYSFKEFEAYTRRIAKGLIALGFRKGDRLVLWLSNFPEWMALWFGCQRAGIIPVPVNTRFRQHDLTYVLQQSRAKGIVIMGKYLNIDYPAIIEEMIPEIREHEAGSWTSQQFPLLQWIISIEPQCPYGALSLDQIERLGERLPDHHLDAYEAKVYPEDIACILFTSGTTSFPKSVLLSQSQIIMNGFKAGDRLGLTSDDRFLTTLPFFGSFMCLNAIFSVTSHRGCFVLQDHFDAQEALRLIEEEKVTVIFGPDTVFRDILNHPDRQKRDLSSWKKGMGAPIHRKTLEQLIREVGVTHMVQGYGLTETSAVCAIGESDDPMEVRLSTVGRPLPGIDIAIYDAEKGVFLPPNERGEIVVKGPSIFLGYEGKPLQTIQATLPGGWFRTGDIGMMTSSGHLVFLGRFKDMLKVGGFSVAAQEIEQFLSAFPEVEEAAIVGLPDERLQEVPAAFIKLLPGKRLTEEEVVERCQQIANYKRPRVVRFVDDFPRTQTGKVKKDELKKMLLDSNTHA